MRKALFAVWLAYTAFIGFMLTVAPIGVVSAAEKATNPLVPFPDPGASARHFGIFFVEGLLSTALMGWDGLAFSVIFGAGTELFQYFMPWRTYDVHDLTANTLGSIIGFAVAYKLMRRASSRILP